MGLVPRVEDLLTEARELVASGMHDAEAAAKVLAPVDLHELAVTDYDGLARLVFVGLDVELNRRSNVERAALLRSSTTGPDSYIARYRITQIGSRKPVSVDSYSVLDAPYDISRGRVRFIEMTVEEARGLVEDLRATAEGFLVNASKLEPFVVAAERAGVERIGDLFAEGES